MDMSTDNLDIMQFFISMLIVGIGVALLATGMFTSYFGAGKSQKIGFVLLATGTILKHVLHFWNTHRTRNKKVQVILSNLNQKEGCSSQDVKVHEGLRESMKFHVQ